MWRVCVCINIYIYIYIYIYMMEYYPAVKQKMNNAICSNMGGPRDYDTK